MYRCVYHISLCLLFSGHFLCAQALTDTEADTIVAKQEQAKIDRQQARIAKLEEAEVISEGRGVLPSGQKVIVREVKPPKAAPSSSSGHGQEAEHAPVAQQATPTPEQIATLQSQAAKETEAIMLSATVYDRETTRLSWKHDSEAFVAYTNADFNYLRGVHALETPTHRISFFMAIGDTTRESSSYPNETIPLASAFSSEHSEYILTQGDPNNEAALRGITALLEHYDANLEDLKIADQRREALKTAKKRYDEANPKEPETFVMQFWVPESPNQVDGE